MSRSDPNRSTKILSVFTEPQNRQVEKLCSMPRSPQTPQVQPCSWNWVGRLGVYLRGRAARQASHCGANNYLWWSELCQDSDEPWAGRVAKVTGNQLSAMNDDRY